MLYSFASLSSNQVCMQYVVQVLLHLTGTQCFTHLLLHFFAFKGGLNMPCHFSCHYVWLPLHVVSFCCTQCACALLLIPVGVFVAGSCTGKVCDPACDPGGRRWLCDCHWDSEGEGPAGDGGQKQDCFCGQEGHRWFPAEVTGGNILEYAWLCLQFIDLNHHLSADTRF